MITERHFVLKKKISNVQVQWYKIKIKIDYYVSCMIAML